MSVKEIGRPQGRPFTTEIKAQTPAPSGEVQAPQSVEGMGLEGGVLLVDDGPPSGLSDGFRSKGPLPFTKLQFKRAELESPVDHLLPDFEKLGDLAHKFGGDVVLLKEQIMGMPGKTPAEKLERFVAFFKAFAEELVVRREQLTGGEAPPPGQPQSDFFAGDVKKFLSVLQQQGIAQTQDAHTGQNGMELAKELLEQPNLKAFQEKASTVQLTAPNWPPGSKKQELDHLGRPIAMQQAEAAAAQSPQREHFDQSSGAVALSPSAPLKLGEDGRPLERLGPDGERLVMKGDNLKVATWAQDAGKVRVMSPEDDLKEQRLRSRSTDKVLGSNMLWNVLHRARDDEDEQERQDKAFDGLAFGAIMLLAGAALVVVILVSL